MRKILMGILVCLLLIGTAFIMVKGLQKPIINGFMDIDEKNAIIDQKNAKLSTIISQDFTTAEAALKTEATKLTNSKTEYENQAILSRTNGSSYASGLEAYDIDYLWTRIGNYAKSENVIIKIDVTATNGASANLYNMNFTVNGTYVDIIDFIYDIENDSKLGFKIDNFKMVSTTSDAGSLDISGLEHYFIVNYDTKNQSSNTVIASFSCLDIPIKVVNVEKSETNKEGSETSNTSESGNTNTTNNTNTTSSARRQNTATNEDYTDNTTNVTFENPNSSNLVNTDVLIKGKDKEQN